MRRYNEGMNQQFPIARNGLTRAQAASLEAHLIRHSKGCNIWQSTHDLTQDGSWSVYHGVDADELVRQWEQAMGW